MTYLLRYRVAETKKTIDSWYNSHTSHTIVSSFQNFDTDGLVISLTFDFSGVYFLENYALQKKKEVLLLNTQRYNHFHACISESDSLQV
jgi:hypothetical protein